MKTFRTTTTAILTLVAGSWTAWSVDFVHQVMPILKEHCAECHTGEKKKGGLAMNTRAELLKGGENGKVILPGNAAESLFHILAASEDDDEWMPPKGDRVPKEQLAILAQWINEGAKWPEGIRLADSG